MSSASLYCSGVNAKAFWSPKIGSKIYTKTKLLGTDIFSVIYARTIFYLLHYQNAKSKQLLLHTIRLGL